jgi:hypothetical protein
MCWRGLTNQNAVLLVTWLLKFRQRKMIISTIGPGNMKDCDGEGQQQCILLSMYAVKGISIVGSCYDATNSEEIVVIYHCSYL